MRSSKTLLLLLVAGWALLFGAGMAAQEKSNPPAPDDELALQDTRTIMTAEVLYASVFTSGYSRSLAVLGEKSPAVLKSTSRETILDPTLATGRKHNYIFTYTPGPKGKEGVTSMYTLVVRPAKWHAGLPSYFADQTGMIRWTNENRAPTAKDPGIQTLREEK